MKSHLLFLIVDILLFFCLQLSLAEIHLNAGGGSRVGNS